MPQAAACKGGATLEPVIGVTAAQDARPLAYVRRIRERGGNPVFLQPSDDWCAAFRNLNALLLTGGADVQPSLYGQAVDPAASVESDPALDRLELGLLRLALDANIPVLGVCRGLQLLNVAFGGKLLQDIPVGLGKHRSGSDRHGAQHPVEIDADTLLAQALGVSGRVIVNSIHHQGLTDALLAPGLRASAHDPHGLIEGLESRMHRWVVGVQWHPERRWEIPRQLLSIFDAFINAARPH